VNLTDPVSRLPKVGPVYLKRLEKLGIVKIADLLTHPPSRFMDFRKITAINNARVGDTVSVIAKLNFIKNQYSKTGRIMQIGEIEDASGKMKIIWFNQPYLAMSMKRGLEMSFSGKVEFFGANKAFLSPEYEIGDSFIHTGRLVPIYPETHGVSSKWLRSKIAFALKIGKPEIVDFIPEEDLKKYSLVAYKNAIYDLHFPEKEIDYQKAKKRLGFDEFLSLTLQSIYRKDLWKENMALYQIKPDNKNILKFINGLPFSLTPSQTKSIEEILINIGKKIPMNRLLEGDVGSGKTVVAAVAVFATFLSGYQSVIMAPTQILANQHFETLSKLFEKYKIKVKLITSSTKNGDIGSADVYIGTHALIHRVVENESVALVVIDEQHRFGVEQRTLLVKKSGKGNKIPHVLTMTATPIPRTIALTVYGDLDLSILKEMPKGRLPITTWIVPSEKRDASYKWIKEQIDKSHTQVFYVCPLIEESQYETMKDVKAVVKEFENLKKIFKKYKVDLLHGRLKNDEKDLAVKKFKSGETDILVSTPVVEVGIDIENATIMVVEAPERFGLAQLHQLRGRVGRGDKKSYCLLMPTSGGGYVSKRLNALKQHNSGFELAEIDLIIRGPGEIFGTTQHGFFELKNASWGDSELIKISKDFADKIVKNRPKYKNTIEHFIGQNISLN
jgi:ATP-dependent DNA helicase RecG